MKVHPLSILTVDPFLKIELPSFSKSVDEILSAPPRFEGVCGALSFFENSSRTKMSFQRAGLKLGVSWIDSEPPTSSLQKGESLRENLKLFCAYDLTFLVVRHSQSGFAEAASLWTGLPVLNAGDGSHEHPTQALGDLLTLWRTFKGQLPGSLCFYGDFVKSRVARSVARLLQAQGVALSIVNDGNPETLLCAKVFGLKVIERSELKQQQIVYCLRTQKERGSSVSLPAFSLEDLGESSFWMHAGPVIEGEDVELRLFLPEFSERSLVSAQVRSAYEVRLKVLHDLLSALDRKRK